MFDWRVKYEAFKIVIVNRQYVVYGMVKGAWEALTEEINSEFRAHGKMMAFRGLSNPDALMYDEYGYKFHC